MGDQDFKVPMSTQQPRNPGGPIIEASPDPEEYNRALKIILGTVVGVIGIVGLIALFFLLFKFWRRRQDPQHGTIGRERAASLRSISIDVSNKQLPGVLVLYSYDCPMHEKVVQSLAGFLMEVCCCNVVLDLFEEQIIHERGLDDWLIERLQEVDYIMVVCSVGARLRCSKKRVRFKSETSRTLPDYFAVAVDYVGEKMRVERGKGLPMSKFITAYMDYSMSSDIPPQLETGTKFCLMKDLNKLYNHLHGLEHDDNKLEANYPGVSESNYHKSEVGAELYVAIEQAKDYFQSNPNWVEDRLQQAPPTQSKSKSRHRRHNSQEQPLLDPTCTEHVTPSITNCVDAAVEVHTLPRRSSGKDAGQVNLFLYSRQNSLPSSLSSRLTVHTSSNQVNVSKSYDSFRNAEKFRDSNSVACVLCGKHSHPDGRLSCKGRKSEQSDIEVDPEYSQSKNKSKSMPTVCGNSLNGSQTVLHAEVHKDWDTAGRVSPISDLQETDSNGSDTLERDLRSITMPPTFDNVHYSTSAYLLSELVPLRSLSSSALVVSNSDDRIRPVPTLQPVELGQSDESYGNGFSLGPVINLNHV
ncbi:interleukin-17 receptor D-like isoform X2 [Haliotis rubra]|uniref:interleukin-17 receptor D-like isoform X2 n=1 Tax=Haliotis rubra TaxID=36100 RepID=UPI001EE62C61|nr:interleukin-17 receptor D-like isoform X2 [Haliotis rubra]